MEIHKRANFLSINIVELTKETEMKKRILGIALFFIALNAVGQKATTPINMGIGNLKLNTILKDSLILKNDVTAWQEKPDEVKTYQVSNYIFKNDTINELEVKTFKNLVFYISFNFTGRTEKMMENNYGISYDGNERTNYKSKNVNQTLFGSYKENKIYFIDEKLSSKVQSINFDCSNLTREIDAFTNEISIRTSLSNIMSLTKIINKKGTFFYLSVCVDDKFLSVKGNDVYFLFEDGSKFFKKTKVDVEVNRSGGYRYSAFVPILSSELQQFCKKKVEKIRLYIFDRNVISESQDFFDNANCIMKAK